MVQRPLCWNRKTTGQSTGPISVRPRFHGPALRLSSDWSMQSYAHFHPRLSLSTSRRLEAVVTSWRCRDVKSHDVTTQENFSRKMQYWLDNPTWIYLVVWKGQDPSYTRLVSRYSVVYKTKIVPRHDPLSYWPHEWWTYICLNCEIWLTNRSSHWFIPWFAFSSHNYHWLIIWPSSSPW